MGGEEGVDALKGDEGVLELEAAKGKGVEGGLGSTQGGGQGGWAGGSPLLGKNPQRPHSGDKHGVGVLPRGRHAEEVHKRVNGGVGD